MKLKRAMKRFLAGCMVMAMAVTSFGVMDVSAAAKNKALQIPFSFDGKNDEKESEADEAWFNNDYEVVVTGNTKTVKIYNAKMSGQIYIPKKVLQKKKNRLNIGLGMGLGTKKNEFVGSVLGRYNFNIENTGKKIKVYGWDNQKQKEVKAGSYATCKAGKGAYKSYYVITLKNIPIINKINSWDAKNKKDITKSLKSTAKYQYTTAISICGLKTKNSGKMYVDNIKVTVGKKTISNVNFNKKPKDCFVYNREKEVKKAKIVKF